MLDILLRSSVGMLARPAPPNDMAGMSIPVMLDWLLLLTYVVSVYGLLRLEVGLKDNMPSWTWIDVDGGPSFS